MAFSTCCGAETNFTEIGICPECMEHCDWEQDELEEDRNTEDQINESLINQNQ